MDAAARETGIDPAELRRRNMIRPEQMPYTNPMGKTYDSGQFEQVLDQGARAGRLERLRRARARESKARGKLRGRGIATFLEWTGGNVFEETRHRRRARPTASSRSSRRRRRWGRASRPRYAQLAVDVFGVPIEQIRIVQGDTDRGNGFGSAGSRSLFIGGSAVQRRVRAHGRRRRKRARRRRRSRPRPPTSNTATARFSVAGTDRRHRPVRARRASSRTQRILVDSTSTVGGADAGRTAATSARSRSIPRPAPSRSSRYCVGQRRRPRRQPDDRARPARRRRGAGHRPGAVRAASSTTPKRPAADRQLHGLRAAARRHRRRASRPSSTHRCRA